MAGSCSKEYTHGVKNHNPNQEKRRLMASHAPRPRLLQDANIASGTTLLSPYAFKRNCCRRLELEPKWFEPSVVVSKPCGQGPAVLIGSAGCLRVPSSRYFVSTNGAVDSNLTTSSLAHSPTADNDQKGTTGQDRRLKDHTDGCRRHAT